MALRNMEEKGVFARLFGFGKRKPTFSVNTEIRIRTVGDIPPMIEAKRLIGNGDANAAIVFIFNTAKKDYARFFGVRIDQNEPNRQFLIKSFTSFGIRIPEEGNLDNTVIQESVNNPPAINDKQINQFSALRKLTTFYIELYEGARFSSGFKGDPELIVERISDVYNYMDIPKLYFSEEYQ